MPTDLDAFLDRFEAQVAQIENAAAKHLGRAQPTDLLDVDSVDAADDALEAKDDFRAAVASVREPLEQVMRGAVTVAQRRRLVDIRGRVEAVLANLSDDKRLPVSTTRTLAPRLADLRRTRRRGRRGSSWYSTRPM